MSLPWWALVSITGKKEICCLILFPHVIILPCIVAGLTDMSSRDRNHLLWLLNSRPWRINCLPGICVPDEERKYGSTYLWVNRCFWLYLTTSPMCWQLTSWFACDTSAYFNCQTFSWALEGIFSYGRISKVQCKHPRSKGLWLHFHLSEL